MTDLLSLILNIYNIFAMNEIFSFFKFGVQPLVFLAKKEAKVYILFLKTCINILFLFIFFQFNKATCQSVNPLININNVARRAINHLSSEKFFFEAKQVYFDEGLSHIEICKSIFTPQLIHSLEINSTNFFNITIDHKISQKIIWNLENDWDLGFFKEHRTLYWRSLDPLFTVRSLEIYSDERYYIYFKKLIDDGINTIIYPRYGQGYSRFYPNYSLSPNSLSFSLVICQFKIDTIPGELELKRIDLIKSESAPLELLIDSIRPLSNALKIGEASPVFFPWPAPQCAQKTTIKENLGRKFSKFHDLAIELKHVLDNCGYYQKSYSKIPGGFALITQLEQFSFDKAGLNQENRWNEKQTYKYYSNVFEYISTLIMPKAGYFRVFVFIVTDKPYQLLKSEVTKKEASAWVYSGFNRLPNELYDEKLTENHYLDLLVYEFESSPVTHKCGLKCPTSKTFLEHFKQSGLYTQLKRFPK